MIDEFQGHKNTDTFNVSGLDERQLTVAALCVNMADGEQRPWARKENLQFFMRNFVRESIQAAINSKGLTEAGLEVAQSILW